MKILLTGATGLVGAAIQARLAAEGHRIVAVTRRKGAQARRISADAWVVKDMARATRPEDWLPHLEGMDAVVNCAGILQSGGGIDIGDVNALGAAALFEACERAGVRRVIQMSAMGADRAAASSFSRSKAHAEAAVMGGDLDWVVLRPSVVLGRPAYGGSALFRGLAALPFLPEIKGGGRPQVVQLDEVVETVSFFLRPGAPARVALDIAGPERLTFEEVVGAYRRWLGFNAAPILPFGAVVLVPAFLIGDLLGRLGWRPPIRTNGWRELAAGSTGDNAAWKALTGIEPKTLRAALMREPASVQERWFANLYFLKPLTLFVLSAFWLITGLMTLGPARAAAVADLQATIAAPIAEPAALAGAVADVAIGLSIAWRPTARAGLLAGLALTVAYLGLGTLLQPTLWLAPLGPLTKVLPILVLNLVALAILEDR